MSKLDKYKGIIPAFYAAYDDEGNISPERVQALAKHYLKKGVKGLYVGGSSGECIYQNVNERKVVLENVMAAVGGQMTIIAHIACLSTRDSVELAKHAAALGVDALAAIPPYYFSLSEDAIEAYWTAMIDATDLDFIIYNIPQTTGYALSTKLFRKLFENEKVIGVKNSSMPTQDIYLFSANYNRETMVFNGPDEQFIAGRVMGAAGGIGGTYGVMPELFLKADEAVRDQNLTLAHDIQYAINDIIFELVAGDGHLYALIKAILAKNGMNIGGVREPLLNVTENDNERINRVDQMIKTAITNYC